MKLLSKLAKAEETIKTGEEWIASDDVMKELGL